MIRRTMDICALRERDDCTVDRTIITKKHDHSLDANQRKPKVSARTIINTCKCGGKPLSTITP